MFGVVSGSLKPVLAHWDLFQIVQCFTSGDVKERFDLLICYKSASCKFYEKGGGSVITKSDNFNILQSITIVIRKWAALQTREVALHSRACITKWNNFYYKAGQILQSGVTFITD